MALLTKFGADRSFVRRFYEEPPLEQTTEDTLTNLKSFGITRMDTVVIVPFAEDNPAFLDISVSYDEPQYNNAGEFIEDEDDSITDGDPRFNWHPYSTTTVPVDTAGESNKTVITQFNTGVSAIRLRARSATAGSPSELKVYVRGYHIER